MQAVAAPVAAGEQRRLHLVPPGRTLLVVIVIERVLNDLVPQRLAVLGELFLRQRLRAADQFAGDAAALAARADAVLHGFDLHVLPVLLERRDDAAMVRGVAVAVGIALPDANRGQMFRLQTGGAPLRGGVVGNSGKP